MPKNIVVCLDGTWNNSVSGSTPSTNVNLIYQSLSRDGQVQGYYPGVGSHVGSFGALLNSASGKGVFVQARSAWKFVSGNYHDGDRIYIFGFSRGAFAARHLAGMIVRHGLWAYQGNIEEGFRAWQKSVRLPCTQPRGAVHLLGLFDCVPGNHLYVWRDQSHHLNAQDLEPGIEHFRHAVSVHERRWAFRPLLFRRSPDQSSFKQCWFPGYHSDVGGGDNVAVGLANLALWWMLREAFGLGLEVENIHCPQHRYGHVLGVVSSTNPEDTPVSSDYFTTRVGLRWDRSVRETNPVPDPTPEFADLADCPRCGNEMFDIFKTDYGLRWLERKGLRRDGSADAEA